MCAETQSNLFAASVAETDRHRRLAAAWYLTDPLGDNILGTLVAQLFQRLMKGHLYLGSADFEARQLYIETQALAALARGQTNVERRSYAILELARGTLETQFDERVDLMLLSASMWREILPRRFYTQKFMCRSFRTLSHSKCVVAAKIWKEIRRAPISSFLILDNDAEAEKLAKTPLCLVDEVFVQFLMVYGRSAQALRSREVQHIVRLHAQLAKVNIAWLESLSMLR